MTENPDDPMSREWIAKLVQGDPQVTAEFWELYGDRLVRVAERHLGARLQRREGPDDVVQSVCRTFWRRAQKGMFELADSDSLWRLLCAITVTKVRQKARFHRRDKRSVDREQQLAPTPDESRPDLRSLPDDGPAIDEAAEIADELEAFLGQLDDEQRQLVELRLQGLGQTEIAREMECSERTVRRILARIESQMHRMLEE